MALNMLDLLRSLTPYAYLALGLALPAIFGAVKLLDALHAAGLP